MGSESCAVHSSAGCQSSCGGHCSPRVLSASWSARHKARRRPCNGSARPHHHLKLEGGKGEG